MSRLNGGVDALLEKDTAQKEWQDVENLVDAESLEANAQEKTECEQVVGDYSNNAGSSGSAGASTTACAEACKNQERFLANLANDHVRAYVKLLPEPTTIEGVKLAVSQSSVSTIHGQARRNVFMIALSVDNLGEVAGKVARRRPPVEFVILKKLAQ